MARAPTVKLNSGFEMPVLGLGTFSVSLDHAPKEAYSVDLLKVCLIVLRI